MTFMLQLHRNEGRPERKTAGITAVPPLKSQGKRAGPKEGSGRMMGRQAASNNSAFPSSQGEKILSANHAQLRHAAAHGSTRPSCKPPTTPTPRVDRTAELIRRLPEVL